MYNKELLKEKLENITKQTFKDAIYLCYKDGITSIAPLGFSGDTIMLYGCECNGRSSVVSIRNYCGNAELLITDKKGSFLFYGRYDISIGIEFVLEQYWKIFLMMYDMIETNLENISEFKNVKINSNCEASEGFAMLNAYQKAHKQIVE